MTSRALAVFYRIKNGSPEFWIGVIALVVAYFSKEYRLPAAIATAFSFGVFVGIGNNTSEWLKSIWMVRLTLDKLERWKYNKELNERDARDLSREVHEAVRKATNEAEEHLFLIARDTLVLEEFERCKVNGWPINSVLKNNAHQAQARLDATKKVLGLEDE